MLVFALVGGAYLHYARQSQASKDAAAAAGRIDSADPTQLFLQQAAQQAANAPHVAAQQKAQVNAQHSANAAALAAAAAAHKAEEAARAQHSAASRSQPRPTSTTPNVGPIPSSCSAYSGNRAIGCSIVVADGLSLTQMACLDKMWTRESNWRTTAKNASSGAYGIPQALPASKMAAYGSDYLTNPVPQIKWGLAYIKGRYSTPCGAWSFWQAHGWY
jgi:hypothetical protein